MSSSHLPFTLTLLYASKSPCSASNSLAFFAPFRRQSLLHRKYFVTVQVPGFKLLAANLQLKAPKLVWPSRRLLTPRGTHFWWVCMDDQPGLCLNNWSITAEPGSKLSLCLFVRAKEDGTADADPSHPRNNPRKQDAESFRAVHLPEHGSNRLAALR